MLTARAEIYPHDRWDLKTRFSGSRLTRKRGPEVLHAPGVTSKEEIATLVRSVDRPVHVLIGLAGVPLSMADLSAIGVRRVGVGSGLARLPSAPFYALREKCANTARLLSQKTPPVVARSSLCSTCLDRCGRASVWVCC